MYCSSEMFPVSVEKKEECGGREDSFSFSAESNHS